MSKQKKTIFIILVSVILAILMILGAILAIKPNRITTNNQNVPEKEEKIKSEEQEEAETYTIRLDDGTKVNNSENLKQTKTYKNIEISNIQFTSKDNNSILLADIKNIGESDFEAQEAWLKLLDDNNNEIRQISIYIPQVSVGETKQLNSIITADIINVSDFVIEEK